MRGTGRKVGGCGMIQDTVAVDDMTPADMQNDLQSIGYDGDYLDTLGESQIKELFYHEFRR